MLLLPSWIGLTSKGLWLRWIHTGEAGGIVGQTIAGLATLVSCRFPGMDWFRPDVAPLPWR